MNVILKVTKKRAKWWQSHLASLLPDFEFFQPDEVTKKCVIEYAIVWRPAPGWLKTFPNLKCIISIGSGIDHILSDPELPKNIPIIRTTGPILTNQMREYVVLHVLRLHRELPIFESAQNKMEWKSHLVPPASERSVGIMGLGNLGSNCAHALSNIGFKVCGWAKSQKSLPNIKCFSENDKIEFLNNADILVCMLPLTPETDGILNSELFSHLPSGASLINVARGQHLIENDLLDGLKSGHLRRATLDVFREEPLPENHPFWTHPNILITPHTASIVDPVLGGQIIADNLKKFVSAQYIKDLVLPGNTY